MRISYNWLKTFIELKETPEEVAGILTSLGFETTAIPANRGFKDIIVGKVLTKTPHPNASKLSLCEVSTTSGNAEGKVYKVVCGAPNVAAGQLVPLALPGSQVGDVTLKKTEIRGVLSEGMICSAAELGIDESSASGEGIMALSPDDKDVKPGVDFSLIYQPDTVLEIEPLPNRPDVLSVYGVAVELSARLGRPVTIPPLYTENIPAGASPLAAIAVKNFLSSENRPDCPLYMAIGVSGILPGVHSTPEWMKNRLRLCGLRPINPPTDITNYVLLEIGHPLHAFDRGRLFGSSNDGEKIFVRYGATNQEKILALDGRTYELNQDDIVISAGKTLEDSRPAAIAGVMGGEETSVREDTTSIVLESAVFNPSRIFKTRRRLKISTESSYRFERGVSRRRAVMAARRACYLLREILGKEIRFDSYFEEAVNDYFKTTEITLFYDRIKSYAGLDIHQSRALEILSSLGFSIEHPKDTREVAIVSVPEERMYDIKIQEDVIEEIVRVYGYDNLSSSSPASDKKKSSPPPASLSEPTGESLSGSLSFKFENELRRLLKYSGLWEEVNYGLVDAQPSTGWFRFFDEKKCFHLQNPISPEMSVLRPSLFCELWKNFVSRRSADAGVGEETAEHRVGFEIGSVFYDGNERRMLGIIGGGNVLRGSVVATNDGDVRSRPLEVDFYFLKNIVEKISRLVSPDLVTEFHFEGARGQSDYLAYRINTVLFDAKSGQRISAGTIGPVSPRLALEEGIKSPVWWLEMEIEPLVACHAKGLSRHPVFKPYSAYPAATMDFSFFMPLNNPPLIGEIENEIRRVVSVLSHPVIAEEVFPVDIWHSAGDASNVSRTSITLRLVVRSFDGTLEPSQLKILSDGIIKHLSEKFGVIVRTPDKNY